MDRSTFDKLTRRVGIQTTRRAAVATLLGGALLLGEHPASEATDRAQRRKRKKRNQRDNDQNQNQNKTGSSIFKRGISYVIDNTTGAHAITVESGEVIHQTRCCNGLAAFTIPAGETRLFDTSSDQAYAWIDNRYWIEFFNPFFGLPWVTAAIDGMADGKPRCCKPGGTTVVDERTLEEGDNLGFALGVQEFLIHRNEDKPDFKFFNLKVG